MCDTRQWKDISAREYNNTLFILARRSDGVIINLVNNLVPREFNLARQFKSIIDLLESYRNCKCEQGKKCINHTKIGAET